MNYRISRREFVLLTGDGGATIALGSPLLTNSVEAALTPDTQMKAVLDELAALNVHDPRVLWPDTLSVATDNYLYFTANQLHRQARYHNGKDLRQKPYSLFRFRIDAKPVSLK